MLPFGISTSNIFFNTLLLSPLKDISCSFSSGVARLVLHRLPELRIGRENRFVCLYCEDLQLLGWFAKLQKATIRFVLSVRMAQLDCQWTDFHEI